MFVNKNNSRLKLDYFFITKRGKNVEVDYVNYLEQNYDYWK